MTGFGQSEKETAKFSCKVEIKSLNNKFLEINLRMPRNWQHKEQELRREAGKLFERGSVSLFVTLQYKKAEDTIVPINHDVALYYINELKRLSEKASVPFGHLSKSIFEFPNVTMVQEEEQDEDDWKAIFSTVLDAFARFDEFRKKEGAMLSTELGKMCGNIMHKLGELDQFEHSRIETIRNRMKKELVALETEIDNNRFEQELLYYIEKLDISEEKARLKQHCAFFNETTKEVSSGKKLGFIVQEMGREINTIGSKANQPDMQRKVVEMKDELEKIKEQLNNVL